MPPLYSNIITTISRTLSLGGIDETTVNVPFLSRCRRNSVKVTQSEELACNVCVVIGTQKEPHLSSQRGHQMATGSCKFSLLAAMTVKDTNSLPNDSIGPRAARCGHATQHALSYKRLYCVHCVHI